MLVTRPRDMRRGPARVMEQRVPPGDAGPYGPSPPAAQTLVLKFTGGRLP